MIDVSQDRIVGEKRAGVPVLVDEPEASRTIRRTEPGGLAGWLLGIIRRQNVKEAERHLHVIETLALGGRRQLQLITCDGERFLVGSGADRVETIVRVGAAKSTEESWV